MYRSASTDYCQCRKKSCSNTSNLHVKFQHDKIFDKFKSVCTQTDTDSDFKAQEQIAELLSEIAVTLNQKSKLEVELASIQATVRRNEELYSERKVQADEEVTRLINYNQSKDNLLSNLKISHLEEQKALLAQINELKTEINVLKGEKEQLCHDASSERLHLEQKLNAALSDLKHEVDKNETNQSKLGKYKHKMKFLAKYTKHLIDVLNAVKCKKEEPLEEMGIKSRTSSTTNGRKCLSNENISNTCYNVTANKNQQPDIENMILAELFFKPNPVPMDVASLFFCSDEEQS